MKLISKRFCLIVYNKLFKPMGFTVEVGDLISYLEGEPRIDKDGGYDITVKHKKGTFTWGIYYPYLKNTKSLREQAEKHKERIVRRMAYKPFTEIQDERHLTLKP